MPNKLSRFWQELKRRKVIHVITVYAGVAFVIIELINNVTEPLRLPEWTPTLVITLLLIGFPIAVIFSWIYDIHPEGGIVKTKPAHKVKPEDIPKSSNSWKIASYISFVVIVGLIILNIIPRAGKKENLDKSIAVLPFESLSDDPEIQYQADGVMDAILLHLSKIEDLRVMSRTSVEQYRDTKKTIPEICEELGVSYALEGSFRRYGDQARLIVQLIQSGREEHLWANNYDRDWKDIFNVESEVAQAVAGELQAVITPELKQRIEKVPTSNLTAYEYYLRGRQEQWNFSSDLFKLEPEYLEHASDLYHMALDTDSTYAQAYAGLAEVFLETYNYYGSLMPESLDSSLILADRALQFDSELALAHSVKGRYYVIKANERQAFQEFEKVISLNPNDYQIYINQGTLYYNMDWIKSLENFHKAASLISGKELEEVLRQLDIIYMVAGFEEKGSFFAREAYGIEGDSSILYFHLALVNLIRGNSLKTIEYMDKALSFNPEDLSILTMKALYQGFVGKYKESLQTYELYFRGNEVRGYTDVFQLHRLGYAYWQLGQKEKAEQYFDQRIAYADSMINHSQNPFMITASHYDLSGTYAFLGMKEESLDQLRQFVSSVSTPWLFNKLWLEAQDPLFESIRDDPVFQELVGEYSDKCDAQHERIKEWLEENDML